MKHGEMAEGCDSPFGERAASLPEEAGQRERVRCSRLCRQKMRLFKVIHFAWCWSRAIFHLPARKIGQRRGASWAWS